MKNLSQLAPGTFVWEGGLGFRKGKLGGTWYKQTWTGGRVGSSKRVKLGTWPEMDYDQAKSMMSVNPVEQYLRAKDDGSDYWKAVRSRLYRASLPKTKQEIRRLLDDLPPSAARSMWVSLSGYYKWAVERDLEPYNPLLELTPPPSTPSRERVLMPKELERIWHASDYYPFGHFVRALLLTAQRRDEVAQAHRPQLFDEYWLNNRTKMGRPNIIPFNDLIAKYLQIREHTQWIFTTDLLHPISGFSKWKRELDKEVRLPHWTLHDLRRTAATGMAGLGISPFTVERVLGHALPGVMGIYNRFDYFEEKREALERWAEVLSKL